MRENIQCGHSTTSNLPDSACAKYFNSLLDYFSLKQNFKHTVSDVRKFVIILTLIMGSVMNVLAQVTTTDSIFIHNSRPINFVVDKIDISDSDRRWITDTLIPQLRALGKKGIVIGRAAASPEGPEPNNVRLANQRRASVDALLQEYGISPKRIRYDVIPEDYPMLRSLMYLAHDDRLPALDMLMSQYTAFGPRFKAALKEYDEGRLWRHLLDNYFGKLRAVRIMAIDRDLTALTMPEDIEMLTLRDIMPAKRDSIMPLRFTVDYPRPLPSLPLQQTPRRELLSVKTNLLFDFAYMPGYDRFCPIPNIAIEYYPLHGHFTYGASFDCPWWQNYNDHKYFQVRNYQIHTRYYLRSGDIALRTPGDGAAFKGLYFSAYAHAGLYNICFDERRGWEGEGFGGGLGIGYVTPLSRNEHWRLEFGLQAGFFYTPYDPYQWLCPIDPDNDVRQYYYKWYGDAKDFKTRQHRYTWFGPTRIEVTLSYDLLYRKRK